MDSSSKLFFSIIIPAHNEEKYIASTIKRLLASDYPAERFEVIVVENGSSDDTAAVARKAVGEGSVARNCVKVFSIPEAGVSKARNFGISKAKKDADWVFFLDADTFPEPPFLKSLSDFLKKNEGKGYAVGTAELLAYPQSFWMDGVYGFTNLFFKMKGAAYGGALFVRRPLLEHISFDEHLQMSEDEALAKKLRAYGSYFFFSTDLMHTSTRRYQNGGWKKIPVWIGLWFFAMILPHHADSLTTFQRRLKYKVVR